MVGNCKSQYWVRKIFSGFEIFHSFYCDRSDLQQKEMLGMQEVEMTFGNKKGLYNHCRYHNLSTGWQETTAQKRCTFGAKQLDFGNQYH